MSELKHWKLARKQSSRLEPEDIQDLVITQSVVLLSLERDNSGLVNQQILIFERLEIWSIRKKPRSKPCVLEKRPRGTSSLH